MDLSIIIVNWNSRDILRQCLASIAAHVPGTDVEIIVIDSGSFDGCDAMLHEHYPAVRFIQIGSNLGFAKANNVAAKEARGKYLLFLNPDTEVVGDAIDILRRALETLPGSGIAGSRLLNSNGTVQTSCIQPFPTILNQLLNSEPLRRWWPKSRLWGMAPLFDLTSKPREVEGVSGACLMVRRATFVEVGAFSEDYFMYAEDMDLAYKVRQAGYTSYYVPAATVIHHGGNSSGQAASTFAAVMLPEAIWRFLRKTRGGLYAFGYRTGMGISALLRLLALAAARSAGQSGIDGSSRKWAAVLR
ncbi:MAG: glycosyltransferase family 2 protein, partial [Acidobacteria bacterium]|nr:glycosyltransferase family 2 protein [Acidobacteriota bacterium]